MLKRKEELKDFNNLLKFNWKILVKRESTFLERDLRMQGYLEMLPKPFTVKLKDLLAIFKKGFTTQYIIEDDFSSKEKSLSNDIKNLGFKYMYKYWDKILHELKNSSKRLSRGVNLENWYNFVLNYKLARGIILYSFYVGTYLKKNNIFLNEINNLQEYYDASEKVCLDSLKNLNSYLKKLSKKTKIPYKNLLFYRNREIEELHNSNLQLDNKTISQRNNSIFLIYNYKQSFYQGKKVESFDNKLNDILNKLDFNKHELVGTPTYKQDIIGKVRLIKKKSDIEMIEKGDIIVLSMTTQDMVAFLSKVGGIITDEGGALCHAAIISREMKIPCIIGTKIATKVLKNNDRVKIDTKKGIVEIIKKS